MKKIFMVLTFSFCLSKAGFANINLTGMETGDSIEFFSTAGTFSISTSNVRTGTYALRTNPTTSGSGSCILGSLGTDGSNGGTTAFNLNFARFYFDPIVISTNANGEEFFVDIDSAGAQKLFLRLNSSGKVVVLSSANAVSATGTTVLSTGTYYRFEVEVGTNAAGSQTCPYVVKINGATELSSNTFCGTKGTGRIAFGKNTNRNASSVDYFFDDILWSSVTFPGAGQISVMTAASTGTFTSWTIGVGSGAHWQQVADIPPDGATTSLTSTIANSTDTVGVASLSGVQTVNSVKSISDVVRTNDVCGGSVQQFMRSGTVNTKTATDVLGTSFVASSQIFDTDPNTNVAWTSSGINSAETGVLSINVACQPFETWTGLMVDYIASPPIPRTKLFNSKIYNAILR